MKRLFMVTSIVAAYMSTARGQVIEFESNGLKYQTLTRSGVTVIFAHLAAQVNEYSIVQVSVANGSNAPYTIRPEDFSFVHADGSVVRAVPSREVVAVLYRKGRGGDVVKLVNTYEAAVYGNAHLHSTNGYEQRRQGALAMSSSKLRAAATASALVLVQTKLEPGQSTDGAVFFSTAGKPLGSGKLVVRTNTDTFEFLARGE